MNSFPAELLAAGALPPQATFVLAVALIIYLIVLTALSISSGRQIETQEDYLVAGRKLSVWLCWGTLVATWFGAETMTAVSEAARESGLRGVILDPFACAAMFLFAGLFYAAPMWRMKLLTTGDFFRRTYGPEVELFGACLQVPSYFGWIAVQYQALGELLNIYFGIPTGYGILLACAVTMLYTMIGGMWSVTLTDTLQIVIAFLGLIVLAYTVFASFGGGSALTGVNRLLTETEPSHLTLWPEATTFAVLTYGCTWVTGICGNVPSQDVQQRIFSARDPRTATWACYLAGGTYLLFGMIPVSLGLLSRLVEPEATTGLVQLLASRYLSPALAILFAISFVSIIVSTSTSAVLAPATILSHNVLGRVALFRNRGLLLDRVCIGLIALGSLSLAFSNQSKMELVDLAISLPLVSLFVPLTAGLYGRPRSRWSALLSMGGGSVGYLLRWLPEAVLCVPPESFTGDYPDYIAGLVPSAEGLVRGIFTLPADLVGLTASLLGYLLGQWLARKAPPINGQTLKDAWGV